ncbi:SRPBCC family protein [Desertimonas flava]|uniref:SRPBCC family protein n=1 Tax=Desertimonas flava TaxID=2064846 RepID=UPI000E34AE8B|nr:SRPBCC domain-containing protein [Desertimonas flava]
MADIIHRIGTTTTPDTVYDALTTLDGLAGWWTNDTTGDPATGGTIKFRFGEAGGFDMRVLDRRPAARVEWEVIDGPAEWIGTHVSFDLASVDGYTIVLFKHEGWREPVEFMAHCSTRWATFLLSLKQYAETGAGEPYPEQVAISNWT